MKTFKHAIYVLAGALLGCSVPVFAMQQGTNPQHMVSGQNTKNTWYDQRIINRGAIYFYDQSKPYYWMTNFFETPNPIHIDGFDWPTTEQYYQAGKFKKKSLRSLIRTGKDSKGIWVKPKGTAWGRWAFEVAAMNKKYVRKDWEKVIPGLGMDRSINRMLVGLRAKFAYGTKLGNDLLATYPNILVEDSPYDGFFGSGNVQKNIPQGTGENLLGRMLMHVRKELFRKSQNKKIPERSFDVQKDFTLNYLLTGAQI